MKKPEIEKMLERMGQATDHSPGEDLSENIKRHIPDRLYEHKAGRDTVSIMINLRISRLAAAAIIILTIIIGLQVIPAVSSEDSGLIQDGRMWLRAWTSKSATEKVLNKQSSQLYRELVSKGKDITYYGESINPDGSDSILMHWKVDEDKYMVIFGNLKKEIVSSEDLIKLQSEMLSTKKIM